ncbi:MAG TPA: Mov34/MPN/PAD-1 family protein [Chloroflexia bacterium]|nr:Mov34/MPN/PAD-1 family protein [Chloroflexia bacterium]
MSKLVTYNIFEGGNMPPIGPTVLYEYWLAGNGLYLRAKRIGMEVLMPLAQYQVRGLPDLDPYLRMDYPPVPQELTLQMIELSRKARDAQNLPLEKLFHFSYSDAASSWQLEIPAQIQTNSSVKPVQSGTGSSYERAILEIHSHHTMRAFFSMTDNRDEARSFRLFGVIGRIFEQGEIRLRVGVFGHFWEVAASTVLELPQGVQDCLTQNEQEREVAW